MCVYCLPNNIGSVCSVQLNFECIMMSRAHVGRTNSTYACLNVAANSCCWRSSLAMSMHDHARGGKEGNDGWERVPVVGARLGFTALG
jgi:hypothetical protein